MSEVVRKPVKVGSVYEKWNDNGVWKKKMVGNAYLTRVLLPDGNSFEVVDIVMGEKRYTIKWNMIVDESFKQFMAYYEKLSDEDKIKILEAVKKRAKDDN